MDFLPVLFRCSPLKRTTAGDLGYHGPFADPILAAMPGEHVTSELLQ